MAQAIRYGPIYFLSAALALIFTFVVVWFEFADSTKVLSAFIVMCLGGWGIQALCGHMGLTKGGSFSWMLTMVAVIAMWVETGLAQQMFSVQYAAPGGGILVGFLFAFYEQNMFLSIVVAGNAAGLPSLYIMIIAGIIFVPLHAFSQPDDPAFNAAAFLVQMTLTGITCISKQTDPAFGAHELWNVVMNL
jgi:hypothetical protein